jgi:hypothetical protein
VDSEKLKSRKMFKLTMIIMNLENQLLEKFEVEELEKRYEFAWIKGGEVSVECDTNGHCKATGKVNF